MKENTPTIAQIKDCILPSLKSSGWYQHLRMFVNGEGMNKILQGILDDRNLEYRITPQVKHLLRAFETCPFEKTKVVIYSAEISPHLYQYTGILFSQDITKRTDNNLKNIHAELVATVPKSKPTTSLEHWCQEGVLLLSRDLSTIVDKAGAHEELYRPWNNTMFDLFRHELKDCVFVLVGESVWHRTEDLHKDSVVIKCVSPRVNFPALWGSDVFNKVNQELIKKGKEPTLW